MPPVLRTVRIILPLSQLERLWIHAARERTTIQRLIERAVEEDLRRPERRRNGKRGGRAALNPPPR